MDFTFTAESAFSASHEEEFCPLGPRLHGHRWRVAASLQSHFDPIKKRLHPQTLLADLIRLLDELNGRHLNDMMQGTATSPENLATWVLERLSLQYRTLTSVTVWVDEAESVTVRREVRA